MAPGLEKIEKGLFYCLNSNLFICYPYGSGIRRKGVSVAGRHAAVSLPRRFRSYR